MHMTGMFKRDEAENCKQNISAGLKKEKKTIEVIECCTKENLGFDDNVNY